MSDQEKRTNLIITIKASSEVVNNILRNCSDQGLLKRVFNQEVEHRDPVFLHRERQSWMNARQDLHETVADALLELEEKGIITINLK